jgi:hypothetical protein
VWSQASSTGRRRGPKGRRGRRATGLATSDDTPACQGVGPVRSGEVDGGADDGRVARRRKGAPTPRRSRDRFTDAPLQIIGLFLFFLFYIQVTEGLSDFGWSLFVGASLVGLVILTGRSPRARHVIATRLLHRGRATLPQSPVAASREPIPAGLRFAVLRRDGFRCAYCGRGDTEGVQLHIDHLVPVSRGGATTFDNLVTACQDCNLGKSASDLIGGP